jgi:hypothetical protein
MVLTSDSEFSPKLVPVGGGVIMDRVTVEQIYTLQIITVSLLRENLQRLEHVL